MDEVPADLRTNTLVDTHFSSGSMTSTTFYELQDQMKAAAEAEDYERAAYLKQLLKVLGPCKEPITLEDACPPSADAQAEFFLEHGFVCVPSLEGAALERVQAAYLRVADRAHESWLENCRAGTVRPDLGKFYGWPMLGDDDDDCLWDILDSPNLIACLTRVLGGEVFGGGGSGRVVPSEPDKLEELEELMDELGGEWPEHPHSPNGYISWHR